MVFKKLLYSQKQFNKIYMCHAVIHLHCDDCNPCRNIHKRGFVRSITQPRLLLKIPRSC